MLVRTKHTVVLGGEHHAPESILHIDDQVELERLIGLDAVEIVEDESDTKHAKQTGKKGR